jgi:hypothetical protein
MSFSKDSQLKRTTKKKNQTQINRTQRQKIATICRDKGWTTCRFNLPGCMIEAHDPAHRHERDWFKGKDPNLLSALDQWLPACRHCHEIIDNKMTKQEREELFVKRLNDPANLY